MARGRPRKKKVLHVMFDTNALFNKSFERAVDKKCADAISSHSMHGDLDVRWIVSEVARFEREYQMRNEFRGVATNVSKADVLLSGNWGVTEERINDAISSRVATEFAELGIEVRRCEFGRVDWESLFSDACFRVPPFQAGDTEKGFRDAILCETFVQLLGSLSTGESAVLVSDDKLVRLALERRLSSTVGLRILPNVEDLGAEITLRVSHVDAQVATEIEAKAAVAFLNGSEQKALWHKGKIYDAVWSRFGAEIKALPAGAVSYNMTNHSVGPTRLIRKDGTRVHFMTPYFIISEFNYPRSDNNMTAGLLSWLGDTDARPKGVPDIINIFWSATLSKYKRLIRAKLDGVERAPTSAVAADMTPSGQT